MQQKSPLHGDYSATSLCQIPGSLAGIQTRQEPLRQLQEKRTNRNQSTNLEEHAVRLWYSLGRPTNCALKFSDYFLMIILGKVGYNQLAEWGGQLVSSDS